MSVAMKTPSGAQLAREATSLPKIREVAVIGDYVSVKGSDGVGILVNRTVRVEPNRADDSDIATIHFGTTGGGVVELTARYDDVELVKRRSE